jgi:TonB-dependent starch-binding outer membrane protein SusC
MTKTFIYALILQCMTMTLLFAWNGTAQVKSIDKIMIQLEIDNLSVENAFSRIEKETGFNFVFAEKDVSGLETVSTNGKNK